MTSAPRDLPAPSADESCGSVSRLIENFKAGDAEALGEVMSRYWPFLRLRAGKRMAEGRRRAADEDDAVQEAFVDFHAGLTDARWTSLTNRHDLLAILIRLTDRKAINQAKKQQAQKRADVGESALDALGSTAFGLDAAPRNGELSPADHLAQTDWCRQCLASLPDDLRPFAEAQIDGLTVRETADKMDCTERTVARKLALIRVHILQRLDSGG